MLNSYAALYYLCVSSHCWVRVNVADLFVVYNESRKQGLRLPSNLHLYGAQMTTPFLDFNLVVVGCLRTKTPLRALQLNAFVTSGVVPAGGAHGFHKGFLWMQKSAEAMSQIGENEGSDLIPITTQVCALLVSTDPG